MSNNNAAAPATPAATQQLPPAFMSLSLSGMVAFISGDSSGIGAETAKLMAARGARVAIAARRVDEMEAVVAINNSDQAGGRRGYQHTSRRDQRGGYQAGYRQHCGSLRSHRRRFQQQRRTTPARPRTRTEHCGPRHSDGDQLEGSGAVCEVRAGGDVAAGAGGPAAGGATVCALTVQGLHERSLD